MITVSDITGKVYDDMEVVFFRNMVQSAFYLHHHATLVDVFTDSKGKLVFVFFKKEHETLIRLWNENKKVGDVIEQN